MKMTLFFFLLAFVLAGCGSDRGLRFCEGVSTSGEGKNCGVKFESGDLTALVRSPTPFDADSIDLAVYRVSGALEEKVDTVTVKTGREERSKAVTLSLHQEGTFRVKASRAGTVFAQGDVEIIE
jgi:hypothetical protein